MSHLLPALVRLVTLAAAVLLYMQLVAASWGEKGDANIGAGLLAFAGLVAASFSWALFDARRHGLGPTVVRWMLVALGIGAGWVVVMAVAEADGSMSVLDLILFDAGLSVFIAGLVGVPAVAGAAIGAAIRPS